MIKKCFEIPSILNKKVVLLLICVGLIWPSKAQRGNGNEMRIGLGMEYAVATKAIMPSFIFSSQSISIKKSTTYVNMFFKIGAGPENGYFNGNPKSGAVVADLTANMSGDDLISYSYNGLSGGLALSVSFIPTVIIPTKTELKNNRKVIQNWFYLGFGLQITNHTKTIGSYTVVSSDSKYEYTGIERVEFYPRFFDFSPTVMLSSKKIGLTYSLQSVFDKSTFNHTFSLVYLLPY